MDLFCSPTDIGDTPAHRPSGAVLTAAIPHATMRNVPVETKLKALSGRDAPELGRVRPLIKRSIAGRMLTEAE